MAKRIISVLAVLAMMVAILVVGVQSNRHYEQYAVVTEVDGDTVVVVDAIGYEWAFFGEGYAVDDVVVLAMDNCGTDYAVEDDIICDATVVDTLLVD